MEAGTIERTDNVSGWESPPAGRASACLNEIPAHAASFYHLNSTPVPGKLCNGTACFVARHLHQERWNKAEQQEPRIYCLGQCFAAPAVAVSHARPHMEVRSRHGVVLGRLVNGHKRTLESYTSCGGYKALEQALDLSAEEIVALVEDSGLRGRGGAAFPTGRKWRALFAQSSPEKHLIANGDEGDSGAYIDKYLLEDDPFAVLEGMTIAARATGARKGWIYIRAEHPQARPIVQAAIAAARAANLLGERILGRDFAFEIALVMGRGSYVCGEETALIRSMEGKRPEAQTRPPMPTERGLYGQPTVVNNIETLVNIPWIVEHGAAAYHAFGFSQSRGTKAISLNSLFRRPGLYEVEFGISAREIVEDLGGGLRSGSLKGLIIGGPLAGVVPPELLGTRFGFEELRSIGASVGHGGVIAFDGHTTIPQLIHHVFSFGAYESCGKCTPCRLGTRRVERIFKQIVDSGGADYWDEVEFSAITTALRQASLCGFGTGLAEFADSILRYYGKELEPCFR
ncbi:MAG: formate dehydrogenase [Verrucomicrobia subdivision 3 bacterium]|nr:formate dehydrogenase [Limisphaerales bacterium]